MNHLNSEDLTAAQLVRMLLPGTRTATQKNRRHSARQNLWSPELARAKRGGEAGKGGEAGREREVVRESSENREGSESEESR